MHRSLDGGASSFPIRGVFFADDLVGIAFGGDYSSAIGGVLSTTDGGETWIPEFQTAVEYGRDGCQAKLSPCCTCWSLPTRGRSSRRWPWHRNPPPTSRSKFEIASSLRSESTGLDSVLKTDKASCGSVRRGGLKRLSVGRAATLPTRCTRCA